MSRSPLPRLQWFSLLLVLVSTLLATSVAQSIPAGTQIEVRVTEHLSSDTAKPGDRFHGTLVRGVVFNSKNIPKGSAVTGEVVGIKRSGSLSSPGEIHLSVGSVSYRGRTYPVYAQPLVIKGESHARSNVSKIGGGVAAGTIIGAIAGGGKGAVIGAGVGAAAGTGVAAATGKREAVVPSEAVLVWTESAPPAFGSTAVVPASMQRGHDEVQHGSDSRRVPLPPHIEVQAVFSTHDRQVIRECVSAPGRGLPPGLAKRNSLPPGLERHLERNGTLPPGLEKKVQPLPGYCTARLPRLPANWVRVVVSGQVLLLNQDHRILDLFVLAARD